MDHPTYYSLQAQRKQHRYKLFFAISVGLIAIPLLIWGGWHYLITSSALHSSTNSDWVSQQHEVISNTSLSKSDECVATPAPIFGHNATLSSYWPLSGKSEETPVRFAYVFYATEKAYLCNVLLNFKQLRQLNIAAEIALIYPTSWISQYPQGSDGPIRRMLDKARDEYRVNLHPLELWNTGRGDPTWSSSLTKLHVFGLTNYTRVIYLDSDGIVLNNMDHLFLAPQARIALPRAYWLEQGKLASHIMVITPSQSLMNRVREMVKTTNGFDMEVINKISSSSALILPHRRYALLTGEFRKTDHSSYLSDEEPGAEWNPQAELSSAFFVHFSDWPLPKPWIKASTSLVESTQPACDPKEKVECWNRKHWHGIYNLYNKLKEEVCIE
ncbi:Glucose N-acetyltransferase 1 OS=Gibberella zeae (strain PH-1 / ATCC MYA-4620 / FGSC 9075 / NRRL 31084) GN=GNT1 PE=3 SV=1 [Rhizoctonia solani AG-1 IB]|uniref:Glucose N-acetyltransferase 1 n=1 Tax=Thanatephorus cucumeris (strain AG1-IB / isolate 7/3/14) TaxID=1108050 RepID=A0A0B7FVK2_THACB|nr:Glucose N-acetyltransferase 1 OS=Gibberella zeae (strain PH-1 / ATCC MYA-4620 / FGSC 9075 / NRRL 31084) GN=GNT1 PE=3 SV=1 [Rhizoctonia solani AG-1 IB]